MIFAYLPQILTLRYQGACLVDWRLWCSIDHAESCRDLLRLGAHHMVHDTILPLPWQRSARFGELRLTSFVIWQESL